jgi:hypothetical protein
MIMPSHFEGFLMTAAAGHYGDAWILRYIRGDVPSREPDPSSLATLLAAVSLGSPNFLDGLVA